MVSAAKSVSGKLLGCLTVTLGQERRDALAFDLVPVAVDIVFLGKLIGWICRVAQQIVDGVVVLAMSEPPDPAMRFRSGCGGSVFDIRECGQILDPGE